MPAGRLDGKSDRRLEIQALKDREIVTGVRQPCPTRRDRLRVRIGDAHEETCASDPERLATRLVVGMRVAIVRANGVRRSLARIGPVRKSLRARLGASVGVRL